MRSETQVEAYMETVQRIEPDVHPLDRDGALASIAISLKRIADILSSVVDESGGGQFHVDISSASAGTIKVER